MSAWSDKKRKQQQRRNRKRRQSARQKKNTAPVARSAPLDELRYDEPEPLDDWDETEAWDETDDMQPLEGEAGDTADGAVPEPPELSEREEAALRFWWEKYVAADGPTRLKMTREKLATVSAEDKCYRHLFPEAVCELAPKLSSEQYAAFLEELDETRHDVFAMSADWNTRSMVFEYLAQNRYNDVDRVVIALAGELQEVSDPFFSLMSAIRLAGREEAAEALIAAAMQRLDKSELMYWAVDELLNWRMFLHYQRCVAAGATPDAIDALESAVRELGIEDAEAREAVRRDVVLHLAGKVNKQWERGELTTGKQKASRKIYLLTVDYQRWLSDERQFKPIVADELRLLLVAAINRIDGSFNDLLAGLVRRKFEPYLARKLDFMSLDRLHAPATVVAMKHFLDFLRAMQLVKHGSWQKSQSVCDTLWEELRRGLDDEWPSYRFLEQYLAV